MNVDANTTSDRRISVCTSITGFPVPGGMRSVLAEVAQVMREQWAITYLTHNRGADSDEFVIEQFGGKWMHPWQFPNVWFYSLSGFRKLMIMLHRRPSYQLLLAQDGVFTGAFTAVAGKLAGIRVVCMDHGNMTLFNNKTYRTERLHELRAYTLPRRLLTSLRLACYWKSLHLLAWITALLTDHFLVASNEVAEVYQHQLGVHPDKMTCYAYTVDIARFTLPDMETRTRLRRSYNYSEETILITLLNRLAPEKGLFCALEGIDEALKTLEPAVQQRVKILIVGDGPLRSSLEDEIQRRELTATCLLYGEANAVEVAELLMITDIFLFNGTRGTNYSMAMLEAMAASCAVVASSIPPLNRTLLAEERGIVVSPDSASEIAHAIVHLCNNPYLIAEMGQAARAYVAYYHSASALQRSLLKASS